MCVSQGVLKDTNWGPHKYPDMPTDIPNYLKKMDISIVKVYTYFIKLTIALIRFH